MNQRRTLGRKKAAGRKPAPQSGVVAAAPSNAVVPIVGVGASAGGLEAFLELLKHLPTDTGFAFVLVQHLDPQHESALTTLLSRATSLPVQEVTDNLRVEPDHVYVIPPNTTMQVVQGALRLEPRDRSRTPVRSIDRFLESLATDRGNRAIGVILSGTATDGTMGLEAVKAEGGITFAQDGSAKYDSMPRSAITAGCVDFVLSPKGIAQELQRISRHPYIAGPEAGPPPAPEDGSEAQATAGRGGAASPVFRKIFQHLQQQSGVDFSLYKSATIERRAARRVMLSKLDSLDDYARFLRGNPAELDALHNDLLISVTSFFRNPEVFELLKTRVFPVLLAQQSDDPIRVWVLGCSTGQEAYSIAMIYEEAAEQAGRTRRLQVFATDVNESLLQKARHGLFSASDVENVSAERKRRFFVEDSGGFRIAKHLREAVVFARQNIVTDPPFSRLDLISCRNLLIYLEPALQRRVMPNFHYALRPGGFLLLGASEAISGYTDLFEPADAKLRLFVRQGQLSPPPRVEAPPASELVAPSPRRRGRAAEKVEAPLGPAAADVLREADRVTLGHYAPPGVLVNEQLQVIHFRGAAGEYLDLPAGKASFDLFKMARETLRHPLRVAIDKARKEKKPVRRDDVQFRRRGKVRGLTLHVIPLRNLKERAFLVLFEEQKATPSAKQRARGGKLEARQSADLERELAETRQYLQSFQEQHEASVEELQAANEEVQSANEELQSINEEMETSKEELESANEELVTINEELGQRNSELGRLNADLVNLQNSTHLTVILLTRDLIIRRFSPEAARHLRLATSDLGRPIGDVRHNLAFVPRTDAPSQRTGHRRTGDLAQRRANPSEPEEFAVEDAPDLESILVDVVHNAREREREVRDRDGRWFLLRARPYLSVDGKVDGAVLVLIDTTELKRTEQDARAARDYAEATVRTAHDPVLVLRDDLRVNTANDAFYRVFGGSPESTEGRSVFELCGGAWNTPRLQALLQEVLPRNSFFNDFEVTHDFPDLGRRTILLNARRLRLDDGSAAMVLLSFHDVTARDRASAAIRQSQTRYEGLVRATSQIVWTTDARGQVVEDSPSWREFTGQSHDERKGDGWLEAIHREDRERVQAAWQTAVDGRSPFETEYRLRFRSGGWRWTAVRAVPVEAPDGSVQEWIGMNSDITARKQDEAALRLADQRKNEFLAILAHELRNPLAPIRNMVEVMKRSDGDAARIGAALETMDRQVGQMTRLIDDLFDISRISRGKIELRRGVVELGVVVRQSAEAARPMADRLGHDLVLTVPPGPMHVYGDAGRLAQAVDNLLNNSCKFTAPGGRITLSLERSLAHAVINVRDTGIGIDPRLQSKVFELFMQVDSSLERAVGGLGIGLTLVKNLVEMHGGTVEVSSRPGEGSEFTLRLPLLAGISESGEPIEGQAPPSRSRRILVVEDNRDSAESLALLLRSAGHGVATAFDGEMGLEKAAAFHPEVILLDLGLPKLNGYEVAKRIRLEAWGKDVVLIAVTGWGQKEDRKRTAAAGFDYHLVKPLDFDMLTRLLNVPPGTR